MPKVTYSLVEKLNAENYVTFFDRSQQVDGFIASLRDLTDALNSGAEAFEIKAGEDVLYRGIFEVRGKEFFVLAVIGKGITGFSIRSRLNMLCEDIARDLGCERISFSTARNGMLKMGKLRGYEICEVILTKDL